MHQFLYTLITLFFALVLGTGEASAMVQQQQRKDKVQKVEPRENNQEAMLSDGQSMGRICNSRPQRIIPSWGANHPSTTATNKFSYYNRFSQPFYLLFGGTPRQETAPYHFDVASRYYVICLRHLIC